MSSRAFKKLYGRNELAELEQVATNGSEQVNNSEEDEEETHENIKKQNLYALALDVDGLSGGEPTDDEELAHENNVFEQPPSKSQSSRKKKKCKKKNKKKVDGEEEDIDALLNAAVSHTPATMSASNAPGGFDPLSVQLKCLNPENEMKRRFGQKVVGNESSRRRQHQTHRRTTHLVTPAQGWHPVTKSGLIMSLAGQEGEAQVFQIEHKHEYQKVQQMFWDAADSMAPENLTAVLHRHPYHIDTLLQLSEVCRMSEDPQMAAELIERALYAYESSFHPLFNMSTGRCRLKYRVWENRGLFLALFRHIINIGNRGCYRTSLEHCKLLLALDPDVDPLCVLLMIDLYALRCDEYGYLLQLYQLWNPTRNLRVLPNFALSVPLAMYHTSEPESTDRTAADSMLQESLMMFPGVLQPLLDACGVNTDEDKSIGKHFGPNRQYKQPPSLRQLVYLYVGRTGSCWKAPECISWLEENVKRCCEIGDKEPARFEQLTNKGNGLFKAVAPQNVCRHLILTDIKEAIADLPAEVTATSVLNYDPLPPADSVRSYERKQGRQRQISNQGFFTAFLNSLRPDFDVNAMAEGDENGAAAAGGDIMGALRGLLNNIELAAPERDDGEEVPPPQDWD